MIWVDWLIPENVEAGSRDASALERAKKRFMVDQSATRNIYKKHTPLHRCDCSFIDQVVSACVIFCANDDEVSFAQ
jgi:hypothetical protein